MEGELVRDNKFFDHARASDSGVWVAGLTPIPMMWAPCFLDEHGNHPPSCRGSHQGCGSYPTQTFFEPVFMGIAYSGLLHEDTDKSALAMNWKRIARSKQS